MRVARWGPDLLLGARMALAGGRSGLVRAALTALGVGLGVALLLTAVSIPAMMQARDDRGAARDDLSYEPPIPQADNTVLVGWAESRFGDQPIRGRVLRPEGPRAPVPPGLAALPRPGEVVVSPALGRLLASPEGALLRDRLAYPVVGTIADEGLLGPTELAFYLGSDDLTATDGMVIRRDHFGEVNTREGLDPVLALLVVIIFVVLLLPVGLFVASAIRFGGESRDRRLAGVRLVGADVGMARRIAAGEAGLSALLGVAVGFGLFYLGRSFVGGISALNISVFPSDLRPDPLLSLAIAVAVPAAAIGVTIMSLRRVVIEPLGVVRRGGDAKRRLWWRLVLPVLGLALLAPLTGSLTQESGTLNQTQVTIGVCLILVGVATLLPWVVQAVVRRLRGGPVPWQLAIRRLQLDGSTSARAVTGIAVAVAGAIGLQMLFASVEGNYQASTGQDPGRAQIAVNMVLRNGWTDVAAIEARLRDAPGVLGARSYSSAPLTFPASPEQRALGGEDPMSSLTIASCDTIRELTEASTCADGDVFLVPDPTRPADETPAAGTTVRIRSYDDVAPGAAWTLPTTARTVTARTDPGGGSLTGVLATPSAVPAAVRDGLDTYQGYLRVDPARADVADQVRNAAWQVNPLGTVSVLSRFVETNRFTQIRRGLYIGAALTLLLIGASLLVTMLEQLRDRRRLLAALVAFGTRRRTLAWSILWQSAVPVMLGLVLATAAGLTLGTVLLRIVNETVSVDWGIIATMSGLAAGVVLLVTALSTPVLFRLMRADGLRTE